MKFGRAWGLSVLTASRTRKNVAGAISGAVGTYSSIDRTVESTFAKAQSRLRSHSAQVFLGPARALLVFWQPLPPPARHDVLTDASTAEDGLRPFRRARRALPLCL